MPLRPSHASACTCARRYEGYKRADGLCDIEAHLIDIKDHDFTLMTGVRRAGEPIHDMWLRVTIDRNFTIVRRRGAHRRACPIRAAATGSRRPTASSSARTSSQRLPQARCRRCSAACAAARTSPRCSAGLPTAAIQTFAGLRDARTRATAKPFQLDHCHALETTTETVRR